MTSYPNRIGVFELSNVTKAVAPSVKWAMRMDMGPEVKSKTLRKCVRELDLVKIKSFNDRLGVKLRTVKQVLFFPTP